MAREILFAYRISKLFLLTDSFYEMMHSQLAFVT